LSLTPRVPWPPPACLVASSWLSVIVPACRRKTSMPRRADSMPSRTPNAARGKLWSFEGYALYLELEKLRAAGIGHMPAHQQRVVLEQIELRAKAEKLN